MDRRILDILVKDGRATYQEIAERVGLRRPSVHARVKKLEEAGVIRGYHAHLDPDAVGAGLVAYVLLTLESREGDCMDASQSAAEALKGVAEVLEFHTVAGEHDALVKLRAKDIRDLERLSTRVVSGAPGVGRIRTMVVLSTAFERPVATTKRPPSSRGEAKARPKRAK